MVTVVSDDEYKSWPLARHVSFKNNNQLQRSRIKYIFSHAIGQSTSMAHGNLNVHIPHLLFLKQSLLRRRNPNLRSVQCVLELSEQGHDLLPIMLLFSILIGALAQNTVTAVPQPVDDMFEDSTLDFSAIGVGSPGERDDCHNIQCSHE